MAQLRTNSVSLEQRLQQSEAEVERLRGIAEAEWSGLRSEAAKAMQASEVSRLQQQRRADDLHAALEAERATVQQTQGHLATLHKELDDCVGSLSAAQNQLQQQEGLHTAEMLALRQQLEQQAEALEQGQQEHRGACLALEDVRQQLGSSAAQQRAAVLQREQLLLRYRLVRKVLAVRCRDLLRAQRLAAHLGRDAQRHAEVIKSGQQQLRRATARCTELQGRVADLEGCVAELESKVGRADALLPKLEERRAGLEDEKRGLVDKVARLTAQLSEGARAAEAGRRAVEAASRKEAERGTLAAAAERRAGEAERFAEAEAAKREAAEQRLRGAEERCSALLEQLEGAEAALRESLATASRLHKESEVLHCEEQQLRTRLLELEQQQQEAQQQQQQGGLGNIQGHASAVVSPSAQSSIHLARRDQGRAAAAAGPVHSSSSSLPVNGRVGLGLGQAQLVRQGKVATDSGDEAESKAGGSSISGYGSIRAAGFSNRQVHVHVDASMAHVRPVRGTSVQPQALTPTSRPHHQIQQQQAQYDTLSSLPAVSFAGAHSQHGKGHMADDVSVVSSVAYSVAQAASVISIKDQRIAELRMALSASLAERSALERRLEEAGAAGHGRAPSQPTAGQGPGSAASSRPDTAAGMLEASVARAAGTGSVGVTPPGPSSESYVQLQHELLVARDQVLAAQKKLYKQQQKLNSSQEAQRLAEQQVSELHVALQAAKAWSEQQLQQLAAELQQLGHAVGATQAQLEVFQQGREVDEVTELQLCRSELQDLAAHRQMLEQQLQQCEAELQSSRTRTEVLQQEVGSLRHRLEEARAQEAGAAREVGRLQGLLRQVQGALEAAEAQAEEWREREGGWRQAEEAWRQKELVWQQDTERLREQQGEAQQQVAALKAEVEAAEGAAAELQAAQAKCQALEDEHSRLHQQFQALQQQLQSLAERWVEGSSSGGSGQRDAEDGQAPRGEGLGSHASLPAAALCQSTAAVAGVALNGRHAAGPFDVSTNAAALQELLEWDQARLQTLQREVGQARAALEQCRVELEGVTREAARREALLAAAEEELQALRAKEAEAREAGAAEVSGLRSRTLELQLALETEQRQRQVAEEAVRKLEGLAQELEQELQQARAQAVDTQERARAQAEARDELHMHQEMVSTAAGAGATGRQAAGGQAQGSTVGGGQQGGVLTSLGSGLDVVDWEREVQLAEAERELARVQAELQACQSALQASQSALQSCQSECGTCQADLSASREEAQAWQQAAAAAEGRAEGARGGSYAAEVQQRALESLAQVAVADLAAAQRASSRFAVELRQGAAQLAAVKAALEEAGAAKDALERQSQEQRQRLQQLQEQLQAVSEDAAAAATLHRQSVDDLQAALRRAVGDLEGSEQGRLAAAEEVARLQGMIAALRQELHTQQHQAQHTGLGFQGSAAASSCCDHVPHMERLAAELRAALSEVQQARRQVDAGRAERQALEEELRRCHHQLQEVCHSQGAPPSPLDGQPGLAEAQQHLLALVAENRDLMSKLAATHGKLKATRSKLAVAEAMALQGVAAGPSLNLPANPEKLALLQLQDLLAQRDAFKAMVIALQGDAAMTASQLAELHAQVRVLQAAAAEREGAVPAWGDPAAGSQQQSRRMLQLELQGCQEEVEAVRAALAVEAKERQGALRAAAELQHQLAAAHAKIGHLEMLVAVLEAQAPSPEPQRPSRAQELPPGPVSSSSAYSQGSFPRQGASILSPETQAMVQLSARSQWQPLVQQLDLLASAWRSAQASRDARERQLGQQADASEAAADEARGVAAEREAVVQLREREAAGAQRAVQQQAAAHQASMSACIDAQEGEIALLQQQASQLSEELRAEQAHTSQLRSQLASCLEQLSQQEGTRGEARAQLDMCLADKASLEAQCSQLRHQLQECRQVQAAQDTDAVSICSTAGRALGLLQGLFLLFDASPPSAAGLETGSTDGDVGDSEAGTSHRHCQTALASVTGLTEALVELRQVLMGIKLSALQHSDKAAALEDTVRTLTAVQETSQAQLRQVTQVHEEQQQRLADGAAEAAALEAALRKKGLECEGLHSKLNALSQDVESMRQRLLQQERDSNAADAQNAALARKCDDLQSSLALKQAEAAATLVAYTELHDQFTQLRQAHLGLQERLQAAEANLEASARQQLHASYNLESLGMEAAALKSNTQLLHQQVDKKNGEIRELNQLLKAWEAMRIGKDAQIASLIERNKRNEEDATEKARTVEALRRKLASFARGE